MQSSMVSCFPYAFAVIVTLVVLSTITLIMLQEGLTIKHLTTPKQTPSTMYLKDCQEDFMNNISAQKFVERNSEWHRTRYNKILKWSSIQVGGHFKPQICGEASNSRSMILVPYRNRSANLALFLSYIHPFLRRQHIEYQIFVVSQSMNQSLEFNRGALFNVGFLYAVNQSSQPWTCVILHDVDHLPENVDNQYKCSAMPRHFNSNDDGRGLPYKTFFGGVCAIKPNQFIEVNGFPNRFFGWGGEDDDFQKRLVHVGLKWRHNNQIIGRYVTLGHLKARPNPERLKLLKNATDFMFKDGLTSAKYKVLSVNENKLYVNITVDLFES